MLALYTNGLYINTSRFVEVDFVKVDNSAVIVPDLQKRILTINFVEGDLSSSISHADIEVIDDVELSEGTYRLQKTATLNGLTYVMKGGTELKNIQQFIVHNSLLLADGYVLDGSNFSILLQDSSALVTDVTSYIEFINDSDYLYIPSVSLFSWKFSNFYFCPFDNKSFISLDVSALGSSKPFALDAATNCKAFIDILKETYPEISFYTAEFTRNTNCDEYMRYEFTLDEVGGNHTPVYNHLGYGKYWYTTIPVDLEYSTTDYLKYLARRSAYLGNDFLVPITNSEFIFHEASFSNAIFWERNDITTDVAAKGANSSNDYVLFGFKIKARIYCAIAQFDTEDVPTILYSLVEVINKNF